MCVKKIWLLDFRLKREYLSSFFSGLKIVDIISRPLRIFCYNLVVVFMAKNNKSGSQSKHIGIKY